MWNDVAQGKFDNRPSYVNWEASEPNDRHYDPFKAPQRCKGEDCVQIKSWNNVISWCDLDCNIQIPYICEKTRGEKIFLGRVTSSSAIALRLTIKIIGFPMQLAKEALVLNRHGLQDFSVVCSKLLKYLPNNLYF